MSAVSEMDLIISDIAERTLGISVLETQNRDSADFHEVAVWNVQTALAAAFEAGYEAGKKKA
jgi:hypothetical protein